MSLLSKGAPPREKFYHTLLFNPAFPQNLVATRSRRNISICSFLRCLRCHSSSSFPGQSKAASSPSPPVKIERGESSSPRRTEVTEEDDVYMKKALGLAREAFEDGEVPIGAVLVDAGGAIVGTGRNRVEGIADVTAHAEMEALRCAGKAYGAKWRLNSCTLYSTVEPCAMCYSAASLARVRRVVYGAPDLRLGACGTWIDLSRTVPPHPFHTMDEISSGVCEKEAKDLMQTFFRERRKLPKFDKAK